MIFGVSVHEDYSFIQGSDLPLEKYCIYHTTFHLFILPSLTSPSVGSSALIRANLVNKEDNSLYIAQESYCFQRLTIQFSLVLWFFPDCPVDIFIAGLFSMV